MSTVTRATPASRVAMIIAALTLIVLAAAPWWAGRADLRLLGEIFLYLSLACLWNLMAGYAGLVSVGQQAFVGFGGYMLFALAIFGGLHPIVAILLAGVLAGLISVPIAALIFRLKGAYFAIGTWVVAEVFRLTFAQISALGGGSGTSLPVDIVRSLADSRSGREALSYWLALGAAVTVITCVYLFLRSRRGLALTAIRDSEVAASGLGIDIWRTKLEVYVGLYSCDRWSVVPAKATYLSRRRILGQRLDRIRDLHRRDRRHRHARRANHRHDLILPAARNIGRLWHHLPHGTWRRRHRGYAQGTQGCLGSRA